MRLSRHRTIPRIPNHQPYALLVVLNKLKLNRNHWLLSSASVMITQMKIYDVSFDQSIPGCSIRACRTRAETLDLLRVDHSQGWRACMGQWLCVWGPSSRFSLAFFGESLTICITTV